ncbi:ELM2 and Myb SANT-like domain containing 1 [Globodera pallida]|nr:ELM2 and Myb SANT-like domain containing 1 [Globodera pallida]
MDFAGFTTQLCTANANMAKHNAVNTNRPMPLELAMEGENEFDEIVPMQLEDIFDHRGHGTERQAKMDDNGKDWTNKSLFCPPAASFFHNQQQNQQHQHHPIAHHPHQLALSPQFPPANPMANYANSINSSHPGCEFGQDNHFHHSHTFALDQRQQKATQLTSQWHQHNHRQQRHEEGMWSTAQMPPLRKESTPALHFNDQHHLQPSPYLSNGILTCQQQPSSSLLPQQMEHPLERTRSLSSAVFCSPSPSTICPFGQSPHQQQQQQQPQFHDWATHATTNSMVAKAEEQRRTKSTALPPTFLWRSLQPAPVSLRRFHSQLRCPRRFSPSDGPLMSPLSLLKPYTPPPILSPIRNGSGLFHRIAKDESKPCSLAQPKACSISDATNHFEGHNRQQQQHPEEVRMTDEAVAEEEDDERSSARKENGVAPPLVTFHAPQNGMEAEEESGTERKTPPGDGGASSGGCGRPPQRKNGFLFSGDGPSSSGLPFAAELEQLRKQSTASGKTHKASIARMSIRNKLSLTNDDFIRKMSTVSMEEVKGDEAASEEAVFESDAIPHINLGKHYQARVKKWADRAISAQERDAIPDRDQPIFESRSIEHIPQSALAAFETLACSVAVPKPGRNKELALHILAENQGNIQAAVMDLLRCDTLDWEQYPSIYSNLYVDVDDWSPEEISSFQDGIYKSEKDFQQVAAELGNRKVRECVSFYYTWKKACPDDYRKLRNLRKKRQLLEQQLDFATISCRQLSQSESHHNGASSEEEVEDDDFSETESDITNPSLLGPLSMDCSPAGLSRKQSLPRGVFPPADLVTHPSATSSAFLPLVSTSLSNSAYPWLHGDIFPSPSSSSTSTTNNEQLHGGGAAQNGTPTPGGELVGTADKPEGEGGRPQHHHHYSQSHGYGGHQHHHKIRSTANSKKGAQPSADGFFHCRLCEKRFEKVKSLNAHMKSHAMKARAEAEVQMQQKHQSQPATAPAFPIVPKKEPDNNHLGPLPTTLGAVNLTSAHAAAAVAALRQLQQHQGQHGGMPGTMGSIMGGSLMLRNLYEQAAAAAQSGAATHGSIGTAAQWPSQQNFNA